MAKQGDMPTKGEGFTERERFDAEFPDYGFLDKTGGYAPGTTFEIDGEKWDVSGEIPVPLPAEPPQRPD